MRYLFSIIIVLILSINVQAGCVVLGGGVPTASTCTTQAAPTDMEAYDSTVTQFGNSAALKYVSNKWSAGESTTLCKVCKSLKSSTGTSPTYSVTLKIYSNNAGTGEPDAVAATFSTVDFTGLLTSSFQWICFTGSLAVTSGTVYHDVLINNGSADTTNITQMGEDADCTGGDAQYRSGDGTTWTSIDAAKCSMTQLWK